MRRYWFISTKYQKSSKFALVTFLLAFAVILLGAYTRITDAGLSCPDWPNCYGYLTAPHTPDQLQTAAKIYPAIPVDTKKAWTEMTHRYFAGTEGIFILILAFSILIKRQTYDYKSLLIGASLIVLLSVQVMLGMLTVTDKLKPVIVLAHLVTGLSLLSLLWWAYLDLQSRSDFFINPGSRKVIPWGAIGLIILALQITLGGWVTTHFAGLACVDFPYCNGKLLPVLQWNNLNGDLITIHMLHRLGAIITATYLGVFAFFLLSFPSFRYFGFLLFVLLCTQISLGVLNIIWLRPAWIALIHHAVAILLLLTMIKILVKANFEGRG